MVDVAQLVEPRIVIPAVAGSSPVVHPTPDSRVRGGKSVVEKVYWELGIGYWEWAVSSAGRAVDS
jgi:hypothetical protein